MAGLGGPPQTPLMLITNPWVTFKRTALLGTFALGAALLSLTVVEEAKAETCNSKPAVCMMEKAAANKAAREGAKPKAQATAPTAQPKACDSKPAVCMLERQREAKQEVKAPRSVPKASAVTACTSKPAVCQRERMRAAKAE
jgi:hypothetical protein